MTLHHRRFQELSRMTHETIRAMTPQRRDQLMQSSLAQAMGQAGRIRALIAMTDSLLRLRAARESTNGAETDMVNDELLRTLTDVTRALQGERIVHAITGSVASSVHGEPAISLDVDLIVRMDTAQAAKFADRLPQHFYRSREALIEAAHRSTVANLVDLRSSLKVDLSVPASSRFFDSVFARVEEIEFVKGTAAFPVVTPEDIILMKLDWRRHSKSAKQWANALGVARTRENRLDWPYLDDWAIKLGLAEQLTALREDAGLT